MNKRACPLVRLTKVDALLLLHECWKEKCAWYLVHSKQCCIPLIASRLEHLERMKGDSL